jgi:RND family efflux transporter MFP subunit
MADANLDRFLRRIRRAAAAGSGLSDSDLLKRFLEARDEAAFELLLRRHERLVLGVCRRNLHNFHDVEDAFQAVFLALARKAGSITKKASLAAWLYKVAYRVALGVRSRTIRDASRELPLDDARHAAAAERDQGIEGREQRAVLDQELSRLPERFRTPLLLCYVQGKTLEEAAAQLGRPRGTIASRLARGRARLEARLIRRGLLPSVAVVAVLGQESVATSATPALIASAMRLVRISHLGKTAAAGAFGRVTALTEEVLRAMSMKKLINAGIVMASVTLLLLGGGLGMKWLGGAGVEPLLRAAAEPAQPPAPEPSRSKDESPEPNAPTVKRPIRREFTPFQDFSGRLEAARTTDVLARVSGRLAKALCQPGASVKKGELLFRIDDTILKETLAKAEASLAAAEARRKLSHADFKRAEALWKRMVTTKDEFDKCAATAEIDAAMSKIADVDVKRARRELEYCLVTAPANGKIGQLLTDLGAPITADKTVLTRITQLEPMHVEFDMDERSFLLFHKLVRERDVQAKMLSLGLADEDHFPHQGALISFADQVNAATGTIRVRGAFPNPDRRLFPGMFARVRMPFGTPRSVLEVPESAICSDQGKRFVFIINRDNVVKRSLVKVGQADDGMRVIEEGLRENDWVVVDGVSGLQPNTRVVPRREQAAKRPGSGKNN